MTNREPSMHIDGAPLAVCINDCEIDFGQPDSELSKLCFKLGCAFAEMRWGRPREKGKSAANAFGPKTFQITRRKSLD
jgi:hypothetical protein